MPQNTASCCSQLKRSGKLDLLLTENDRLAAKRAEAEQIKRAIQQERERQASWQAHLRQQEVSEGLHRVRSRNNTFGQKGRRNKGTRVAGGFRAIANDTPFVVSRVMFVELQYSRLKNVLTRVFVKGLRYILLYLRITACQKQ